MRHNPIDWREEYMILLMSLPLEYLEDITCNKQVDMPGGHCYNKDKEDPSRVKDTM